MPIKSGRRRYSRGRRALSVSDRSGLPFPYRQMVSEPGTKAWVHSSESDGRYNRVDFDKYKVVPEADAQRLQNPRDYAPQTVDEQYEGPSDFF